MTKEILGDIGSKEGLVNPLPEVVMILDLLDDYQAVILSFEEVVVFIVDEVVNSTRVLPNLLLLSGVVERISPILRSLVLHECLREECLVVILDLIDKFFHFPLEFEFEQFLGVDHSLRPLDLSLRCLSDIECIPVL